MQESLFARVTRYPRSPAQDPRENRLTEVTAAVLEHVDGLAQDVVRALLDSAYRSAAVAASNRVDRTMWRSEAARRRGALEAVDALTTPLTRVLTQVTTPKGRFVDLEIWLRPRLAMSDEEDVLVWVEAKHGSDVHGNQLDFYASDIHARPGRRQTVLLLVPRGQVLTVEPPTTVALVEWQTLASVVAKWLQRRDLPVNDAWLLKQYAEYLEEEGLMDPKALEAVHALALMELDNAANAVAGICEHADAWVDRKWAKRTGFATPRGASVEPAYGLDYWANYPVVATGGKASKTWRGGWFEWGLAETEGMDYLDVEDIRGSYAFYAGASFESKTSPYNVKGNEAWVNARLSEGFVWSWFQRYRLVRFKYPDELLARTTVESQGELLGRWVADTFTALAADVPPQ